MTTHEVLVAAKGYLLNHGWKQGDHGVDGGPRCVMGALASAYGSDHVLVAPTRPARVDEAADLIADTGVPTWNDAPERTFDDVIAAFDKAILATAPPLDDTPIFQALESLPAEDYIEALSVLALLPMEALA